MNLKLIIILVKKQSGLLYIYIQIFKTFNSFGKITLLLQRLLRKYE